MSVQRYRQAAALSLSELQTIVDPGATLGPIGVYPEVDVTLADDTQLSVLDEVMLSLGYVFVGTAPLATNPTKGTANALDVIATGPTLVSGAGSVRLRYDSASKQLLISTEGALYTPLAGTVFTDDWISGSPAGSFGWITNTAGAASSVTMGATPLITGSHQGVVLYDSGTAVTGRAGLRTAGSVSNISGAGNTSYFQALFRIVTLSTATVEFFFQCGYTDSTGAGLVGGITPAAIQFVYDRAVNGPNWQAYAKSGVPTVITNTGVPVVAGDWIEGRIELDPAAGARYYLNGVLVATIPQVSLPGAATGMVISSKIEKTVGSGAGTNRQATVDYKQWSNRYVAARYPA